MRTRSTYDPFGWRLQELADPGLNPLRRTELLEDLLVAEAEELVAGRRHLTIVHGEPTDIAEAEQLNDFYDTVEQIIAEAEWSRLVGGHDYLTVTLAGAGRNERFARITDVARHRAADRWQIIEAPQAALTAG
jgi:hypothetical protein